MPTPSSIVRLRLVADTFAGVGPHAVAFEDLAGNPHDGVLPAGDYVVFAHTSIRNAGSNTNWSGLAWTYGGTRHGYARSTFRFSTFGGNEASGGQSKSMFRVTSDGVAALGASVDANTAGASTNVILGSIVAVPTSLLPGFQWSETTNEDAFITTPPAALAQVGGDFEVTADEAGTWVICTSLESASDGSDTAGTNEYAFETRVDGTTFQQRTGYDVAVGYANVTQQALRWIQPLELDAAETVTHTVWQDGVAAGGNLGARRLRRCAFREGPGLEIFAGATSAGLSATNAGTVGTPVSVALPGVSIAVPDAGEELLTMVAWQAEVQSGTFGGVQVLVDGTPAHTPGDFNGISANGTTTTHDHILTTGQVALELASGAHTITAQLNWIGNGAITLGKARGNATVDVPQHFVALRFSTADDPPPDPTFVELAADVGLELVLAGTASTSAFVDLAAAVDASVGLAGTAQQLLSLAADVGVSWGLAGTLTSAPVHALGTVDVGTTVGLAGELDTVGHVGLGATVDASVGLAGAVDLLEPDPTFVELTAGMGTTVGLAGTVDTVGLLELAATVGASVALVGSVDLLEPEPGFVELAATVAASVALTAAPSLLGHVALTASVDVSWGVVGLLAGQQWLELTAGVSVGLELAASVAPLSWLELAADVGVDVEIAAAATGDAELPPYRPPVVVVQAGRRSNTARKV